MAETHTDANWSAGSRQSTWQAKQRALGLCPNCGRKPKAGKVTCEVCLKQRRDRYKERRG